MTKQTNVSETILWLSDKTVQLFENYQDLRCDLMDDDTLHHLLELGFKELAERKSNDKA